MIIRRFFDAEATEGGSGATPEFSVGTSVSLGSILQDQPEETTSDVDETGEEAQPEGVTEGQATETPATKETTTAAETPAQTATPAATENIKEETPAPVETQAAAPVDLKEVLKGKERREVLEALGIDPLFMDMLDYHQNTGDLKGFLDLKTRDWDKATPEELLREELRKEYADLPDDKFQKIFKAEVLNRFAVGDEFTDEEQELGQIRLEREANKIRAQRKAEQAGFKIPEPTPTEDALKLKEIEQASQAARQEYDSYVNQVKTDPVTQKLLSDKRVVIGSGEAAYNFGVDPDQTLGAILDTNKLFESCIQKNADGSFKGYDLNKAYKIAAYALNMDAFEKAYYDHALSQANQEFIETGINPSRKDPVQTHVEQESQAQAFVNRGVHTTLGNILG